MKLFDKCVALIVKFRHAFILAALLGTLLVVAGWAYLDGIRFAAQNTTYEWVSDSTDVKTDPIDPASEFRQSFTTDKPVYGGGFVFSTFDEVCHGSVTLALQDQNGTELARQTVLGIDLLDNTFHQIVFPTPVFPNGETTYDFVLTYQRDQEWENLGVWVSNEPSDAISPYVLNGAAGSTCASFALVTNQAGGFMLHAYFACVAFAAALIIFGYWLVFIRKAKLHFVFIFFALTLGMLYMALIPPYVGPDEEKHIHTAYALSNDFLGIENDIFVSLRASDNTAFDKADAFDIFSYKTVAEHLFGRCEDTTIVSTDHTIVYTEPFYIYLPTAIGLTLARLFGFNYMTLIFFGRVMNLLVYTAIAALAIHLMPCFQRILCVVGLLPMSLMLASAFNYDAITLATAFLYVALVLHTLYSGEKFSWKQLIILGIVGLLLAPMKKLYVFLCLFCCILPLKKCPLLIQKHFWKVVTLGAVLGICLIPTILEMLWVSKESLEVAKLIVLPAANPLNMDYTENYYWSVPYILTHLSGVLKMILRTIEENTGLYLVQLIGGKAGEYILLDLPIWTPLIGLFYGALFFTTVPTAQEKPMLSLAQKCWGALLLLITTAMLTMVCLNWTPLRNTTIWGLQGRYLLPMLPLALLVIQSNILTLKQNIERKIIFIVAMGNLAAIASVFQQVMGLAYNQ